MTKYKIYAGLGGGFGGANYQGTHEFATENEACNYAYNLAVEEYQSYEGCHGILSWDDCREDLLDFDPDIEIDDGDVFCRYQEEIEAWIQYYVRPANGSEDVDDSL